MTGQIKNLRNIKGEASGTLYANYAVRLKGLEEMAIICHSTAQKRLNLNPVDWRDLSHPMCHNCAKEKGAYLSGNVVFCKTCVEQMPVITLRELDADGIRKALKITEL
jgi:hypothetical protein